MLAERLAKPVLHLSREVLTPEIAATKLREFLGEHAVRTLNVAGPRASQEPEIAEFVTGVLGLALRT